MLSPDYQACISFEEQEHGLVRHLSVSVRTPAQLPEQQVFGFIAAYFGFRRPHGDYEWLEEFSAGHQAVNIIELVNESYG